MKVINKALLAAFRASPRCELCRKPCPQGCDAHHIRSKGAGRVDVRCNLLAACRECHAGIHCGRPSWDELIDFVAHREYTTREAVIAEVDELRRDTSVKIRRDG